ncbi:MAG: hypothetical protein DMD67_03850 [Gemmatimonadetes bacterium]|nr:MAG: hypothetical protein DMD67_03850 [Gemmatimonadota bacterium]
MLSVTDENSTTRATSRIFAIIAAFPPPWEWPLTAICDHFGLSSRRNRAHPSSGYCRVRYWSSLVSRLSMLFATLTFRKATRSIPSMISRRAFS